MNKILSLIIAICICVSATHASECYHYHFVKSSKVIVRDNTVWLQYTLKDPDSITYVSQETLPLRSIAAKGFQVLAENETLFLVKDDKAHYVVKKELPYEADSINAERLDSKAEITAIKTPNLICFAGVWKFMHLGYDKGDVHWITVPELPADFEIIKANYRSESTSFLIKTKQHIAVLEVTHEYQNYKHEYRIISGLSPATTVFYEPSYYIDDNIMMDDNSAFIVSGEFNFTEVTNDFNIQGRKDGFHLLKLNRNKGDEILLEDGKKLWVFFKDGLDLEGSHRVNFYPEDAALLNEHSGIIRTEDGYYESGYNAVHNMEAIDMSSVKDLPSLQLISFAQYKDKYKSYNLQNGKMVEAPAITAQQGERFEAISAYRAYTPVVFIDRNFIYFGDHAEEKITKTIPHKSPVKLLTKAYVFDDKMLIEDTLITNIAERGSLQFVGAISNAIQPCDGGRGQVSVVVKYYYFFKDDIAVYRYYSGEGMMMRLEGVLPQDVAVDDFEAMSKITGDRHTPE